ncbi:hypothetical protein FRC01_012602 [Tulasnella sp. 417]|nr:hypothetical protein FRC01_012602 [Tulasnella sp. 417]
MTSSSKRRVAYYYDADVGNFSYGLGHPMKPHRMRMTHQLVSSYGMLEKMDVIWPARATPVQMTRFHTDEYIDFLHRVSPETAQEMTYGGTRFLVGEDNPAFDGLFEFCSISAGGSIDAAKRLNEGKADIGINWAGGLHHAKKREASGFCYVNDIVLAILELSIFEPVIHHIMEWYRPGAVVLQCGADSLSGDKLGVFNLSMHGHANCVRFLRTFNVPLILLGGGGYTIKNVSSAWTYETACAIGIEKDLDLNLPFTPYLEYYGPRYRLEVEPNNMTDDNGPYLEAMKMQALEGLRDLPFAPSVGLHQVPGTDLAEETGIRVRDEDEESELSDLDVQLAQRIRDVYAAEDSETAASSDTESIASQPRRSLMSYFREADGKKRRNDGSSDDDATEDDETEDEHSTDGDRRRREPREPKSNGIKSTRHSRSRAPLIVETVDGLVFGQKSWMSLPDPSRTRSRSHNRASSGKPKRYFFKRDLADEGMQMVSTRGHEDDDDDEESSDEVPLDGRDDMSLDDGDDQAGSASTNGVEQRNGASRSWRDTPDATDSIASFQ